MREAAIILVILLFAAALIYGGLNAAELGMTGLLGRECGHEAFSIRRGPQKALLVTFAGRSACLDPGALQGALRQWWDRLLHPLVTNYRGI